MALLDTSEEFVLQKRQQGIVLLRPNANTAHLPTVKNVLNTPVNVYFLNRNSEVQNINQSTVECGLGWKSKNHALGNNVSVIWPDHAASQVFQHDRQVMNAARLNIYKEAIVLNDERLTSISFKYPWIMDGKIIGIIGFSIMTNTTAKETFDQSVLSLFQSGLLTDNSLNIKTSPTNPYSFTERQKQIIYQLVLGKTAKQIAKRIQLSHRTVEHYIEAIKKKLSVASKADIIDLFHNNALFREALDCFLALT